MGLASYRSSGLIGPHPFADLSEGRVASRYKTEMTTTSSGAGTLKTPGFLSCFA